MLVLDELYQGRKFYREKISSFQYALDKGVLISKYLFYIGLNRHEIEYELIKKMEHVYAKKVDRHIFLSKIKYIIDLAEKEGLQSYTVVSFNQAEIDFIKSHDIRYQILIMTMMCVYKYYGGEFNASMMDLQKISHLKINSSEFKNMLDNIVGLGYFNRYKKLVYKLDTGRYVPYYMPSDKILNYAKMGSYILQFDDFRNIWIRIHLFLGIDMDTIICKDCGCIDIDRSLGGVKQRCDECKIEFDRHLEKLWKKRNDWKHPNLKDSKYNYYYG